jgi:hypothetical protein
MDRFESLLIVAPQIVGDSITRFLPVDQIKLTLQSRNSDALTSKFSYGMEEQLPIKWSPADDYDLLHRQFSSADPVSSTVLIQPMRRIWILVTEITASIPAEFRANSDQSLADPREWHSAKRRDLSTSRFACDAA